MARGLCFCVPAAVNHDDDHQPELGLPRDKAVCVARRAIRWLRARNHKHRMIHCPRCRCLGLRDRQDSSRFQDIQGAEVVPRMKLRGAESAAPRTFSYAELYIGTNGFSQDEVLGSGGFGRVYRARLPSDGTLVAVKSVASRAKTGVIDKTFAAELAAVAQLRHRNLVRLRGWCLHDADLLLVYDYMPNRSLDRILFAPKTPSLPWDRRRRIVTGLAAALFYLHEQLDTQIVHRDVKSSNVMLDDGFNARLGDFGLARWVEHSTAGDVGALSLRSSASANDKQFMLTETSRIGGTMGYLPPESFGRRGTATAKSDVFSFGIVALEVATGRRTVDLSFPDDQIFMLDWVRRLSDEGSCLDAGDRQLQDGSFPLFEMQSLIRLGLLCTLHDPNARPTMKWVMEILSGANSGEIPALPSFISHPQYFSLSSSSSITTITTTVTSSTTSFATARETTIYLTAENGTIADEARPPPTPPPPSLPTIDTCREISFKEIVAITDNFSESKMVAELDFGTGYRGYLDNRYHVLVKRLGMRTCPALRARFSDELRNLGRLRHRHLVQLRGWCTEQGEMLVVYDYSPGDLLSHRLFHGRRRRDGRSLLLPWHHRYHIIKSLASAVLYLHEEWDEQVIHRSITSSAVFLDADMNPRLGSFALAEFLSRNDHGGPHALPSTSSARGIFGYMAPEYIESGEATTAADVYSFGVVILEIVSGEMAVDLRSPGALLVRKLLRFKAIDRLVISLADSRLAGELDEQQLRRTVSLGIACTQCDPASRPRMKEIVSILDGNDLLLAKFTVTEQMRLEEWDRRNAHARSLIRSMQALGVH